MRKHKKWRKDGKEKQRLFQIKKIIIKAEEVHHDQAYLTRHTKGY